MIQQLKNILCLLFIIIYVTDTKPAIRKDPPKIVLITIDGVRWQDMFDAHEGVGNFKPTSRELMPTVYSKFVDNGIAIGKTTPALVGGPSHISMPGYLEIMRGYPSVDCTTNQCSQNTKPTLINRFADDSAVFAGWETIAKVFDNSLAIVNIGRRIRNQQWLNLHIAETDSPEDEFEDEEYRSDLNTYNAAIAYLKVQQPKFLWVSLGDTDEWAHQGNMLPYWIAMSYADDFVRDAMKLTDPNTVFILCPDHGRSNDFRNHGTENESARVWIMIAGAGIPKGGFVSYDRKVYLSDIFPTIMGLTKGVFSEKSLLNYK